METAISCGRNLIHRSLSLGPKCAWNVSQLRTIKYFEAPPNYDHVEIPDRQKPRFIEKVPQYVNVKAPKMHKMLSCMRGPEEVHNDFLLKQYGIIATGGGRLRSGHFEMIRLTIGRKMDTKRMFTIWRVDPPWQAVTKKGQGHRMGGGKGNIDHYVTPVKDGRVIIELGGKCEFDEVKGFLGQVAAILPFKAMAISYEGLHERKKLLQKQIDENINPFTFEYMIKNNLGDCRRWVKRVDYFHFGRYI